MVKNPPADAGDTSDAGSIPGLGRFQHRAGNGNPLQYSCLENPTDRGAWQAAVHGATKSRKQLKHVCMYTRTHTHTHTQILFDEASINSLVISMSLMKNDWTSVLLALNSVQREKLAWFSLKMFIRDPSDSSEYNQHLSSKNLRPFKT